MNAETLGQLRDIQGLDAVPWWPLAPGWWLLAALALLLLLSLVALIRNLRRYPAGSWRRPAWRQLRALRQQAGRRPAQQIAGDLSELLRRIAIARLGRARAAGLSGQRWLEWLQQHDPNQFPWSQQGRALLTLPYAPPEDSPANGRQLLPLIDAAVAWVERTHGRPHV